MTEPVPAGHSYWNPERGERWEGVPWACCVCGSAEVMALSPGEPAAYAIARDAAGEQDSRLGRILVRRPIAEQGWCLDHWTARFGRTAREGAGPSEHAL